MTFLNNKIVAYLSINQIDYTSDDYQTGQPEGQSDQILIWNIEKLGPEPTQVQLDESYLIWENQQIKIENKTKAIELLQTTDWSAIPTIANPQYSDPYLTNQSDFLNYRNQLRTIAINPPETLVTNWPTKPDAIWSN